MKKATVSSQRRPAPTYPSKLPTASNQGSPDCWRGGSSGPAPRLGLERSKQSVWGPSGAAPSAISTPRSAGSPGGGKFGCGWQPLRFVRAPASAALASKAWPRLGHLPTGRGRGLRGSGRSGSGARISGSRGLCRRALGSASSRVGGGKRTGAGGGGGIVRRGGAKGSSKRRRGALLRGSGALIWPEQPPPGCSKPRPGASSGTHGQGTGHARSGRRGAAVARRPPGARL